MLLFLVFIVWVPFLMQGIVALAGGAQGFGFQCLEDAQRGGEFDIDPDTILRCNLWDLLRGWQFMIVPPIIAMVAAPLVSTDLRSNALYIYLAKPLRRMDYVLGKMAAVGIWGLAVTVVPATLAWVMALGAQNEFFKLTDKYEILFEIILIQSVFLLLVGMLALTISSFTKNWQGSFLGFLGGWLGLWIVTNIIIEATNVRSYFYLSLVNNVIIFAHAVHGLPASTPAAWPSVLIILGAIGLSVGAFLYRILKLEVAE